MTVVEAVCLIALGTAIAFVAVLIADLRGKARRGPYAACWGRSRRRPSGAGKSGGGLVGHPLRRRGARRCPGATGLLKESFAE
jgi:hypothetical protein